MISWWLIILAVAIVGWLSLRAGLVMTLLLVPTYLIKVSAAGIPTNLFELVVVGLLIAWVVRLGPKQAAIESYAAIKPLVLPIGLLAVGLVVAAGVAPAPMIAIGIIKGWFVVPLVLYVLTSRLLKTVSAEEMIGALLLSTLPISLAALWQVATGQFITVDGRASAWFDSANYLAMYVVPITVLGGVLFKSDGPIYRIGLGLIGIINLVALYFSFSYGGWLGLGAGLLVWGIVAWRRYWKTWLWALVLPVAIGWWQLQAGKLAHMIDFSQKSSASVRLQVWQTAWLMIREHWLLGLGAGQFRDQYLQYVTRIFPVPLETAILHSHNLYFEFWLGSGLIGLAGFVWLVWQTGRRLWGQLTLLSVGLLASLASVLGHGLVDTTYWKNDLAAVVWVILALAWWAPSGLLQSHKRI